MMKLYAGLFKMLARTVQENEVQKYVCIPNSNICHVSYKAHQIHLDYAKYDHVGDIFGRPLDNLESSVVNF